MVINQELIEARHPTRAVFSVGKFVLNIAKWHFIELLKLALMPLRAGNYYLIKAEALNELFKELDKKSFEQSR
jgi:hypothetical protein